MAKKNQHAKLGFGITDPQDAIHMGVGKRIRLEEVPVEGSNGDQQVGNRAYNDARYQANSGAAKTTRWITPLIVQWSGIGLVYNHSAATYEIEGFEGIFSVAAGQKTLVSADPTNGRFDRFAANTDSQVVVIEGTASPDPAEPSLPFPDTQIAGPVVFVGAGTTEPAPEEVDNVIIYNENTEWTGVFTGSGTANFNNTVNPYTGFKSIDASNVQNNSALEFTAGTDFDPNDFDSLGMQIRLKALMLNGYNLRARFFNNAGTAISNEVTIPINKTLFGAYQFIGLPIEQFTFSATNARRLRLRWSRGSGTVTYAGFYLDAVVLQGGIIPSVVEGDIILTGHVAGSGQTGTPVNVTITEKFISEQTEQTDPLPSTAEHVVRLADGSLRKVADSLIAAGKVDKVTGKSLIDDAEITRLAGINDRFKGKYTTLAALEIAHPTANAGDYAQVDTGGSNPVINYNWDLEDGWVQGTSVGPTISNTDELTEGSTNLYHTAARVLSTIITGVSFVTNRAIEATDSILIALGLLQKQVTDLQNAPTLGAEPVQEKFTYTSPAAQTFVVVGTPNGRPDLYLNGQFIDWTFWTWDSGTKTATFTGATLIDQCKIVIAYYSNLSGTAIGEAPNDGQQYGRQSLGWTPIVAGAGGGLELITFATVINMDGNYKAVHTQIAAIAYTKGSFATPLTQFENVTRHYIEASGSHGKPTFSADFVVQMDSWSNNTGDINQLIFKGSPSGKILVWMDNVELT